jgi:hypothetical protein
MKWKTRKKEENSTSLPFSFFSTKSLRNPIQCKYKKKKLTQYKEEEVLYNTKLPSPIINLNFRFTKLNRT